MISVLLLCLLLVVISTLSWWLLSRLINYLSRRSLVDTPNERSLHQGAVPRGGGLIIVAAVLGSLLVMAVLSDRPLTFFAMFSLVLGWAGLSWFDDRINLSARRRLVFQLFLALLTLLAFGYVGVLQIDFQTQLNLGVIGALLSFVGVIWLSNLYNFMDGMDGLAASQTIVAATTLAFWFWQAGDTPIAICCLVLAAASYGFLLHNWHPATIFMGDVGSVTIGAFFATLLIYGHTRYDLPVISFVILLGVFVFDSSVTVLRRIWLGEKFWLPHRSHYYQRAALAGYSHSTVVIAALVLMVICALIASATVLYRDRILISTLAVLALLSTTAWAVAILESRNARDDA